MEDKFIIRHYTENDFPHVEALWRETGMGSAQRGDTAEIIEKTLRADGKLLVLVERATEKIAGTSWLTSDGRRIYLHHFGILPIFQGHGLSKLLLRETLKICKEMGLQVKLEVHRQNSKAIHLYQQAGFQYLGDYDVYLIRDLEDIKIDDSDYSHPTSGTAPG